MSIIVTGGSGYLGTHICRYLGATDLSRRSGRDILNPNDAAIVADHKVVIHMAALMDKDPANTESILETNVQGTINVLKNVPKDAAFIFASTKDVYGRFADGQYEVAESCPTKYAGQSPLEWSKLIAERYVEIYAAQRGFRAAIFRISNVYAPPSDGNRPGFIGSIAEKIDRGEPIALPGGGTPVRDILHVSDLADACTAFADSVIRNGIYNIGGGPRYALTLAELVRKMEEISGLQATISDAKLPPPVPLNYISDISLADHELGWRPQLSIEDGLATLF